MIEFFKQYPLILAALVFVVMLVVMGLAWVAIDGTRCPSCRRVFVKDLQRKDLQRSWMQREADDYYEGDWQTDQDHEMHSEYLGHFRCKSCGHTWTETIKEKRSI